MRLVNEVTGVVVNVPDDFADRLGAGWQPEVEEAPETEAVKKPTGTRKTAVKK
ncbi:DUF7302 family protein [Trueperella abortisuis]|uniref:DUF7302 family protein n=1 Tax=Trueperella abortisuis TaxID=445930 RepID=UPI004067DD5E